MKRFTITTLICLALVELGNAQDASVIDAAYKAYYTDKDWNKSVELFRQLRKDNPLHADYAVRLAFAYQNAKMDKESVAAFKEAVSIGPWPSIYYYQMAVGYARLQDETNCIKHLQLSIDNGWPHYVDMENDKNFAPFKNSLEFNTLFGRTPKDSVSRTKKWEADLEFLISRLKILHHNMYNKTTKEKWDKEIAILKSRIPKLPDHQVVAEFMKMAAWAGEGHTKVLPEDKYFHGMPITLYHFKDGTYVIKASSNYKELVGKKVIQIGTKKIEALLPLAWFFAGHENVMHDKKMNPRFLVMAEALFNMGATQKLDEINVITEDELGKQNITVLKTNALEKIKKEEGGWVDLAYANVPLYMKNKDDDFWYSYLPDKKVFYLNIHYIVNQNKLRFSKFIDSTFTELDKSGAGRLVIDLRNCGGGNSDLNRFVINAILKRPAINAEKKLYVIIGRNTYSAGMNLVSDLEYRTNAIFVGEPTGSSPNFIGESNTLRLPYSQLYLIISNRYHQGGANNSLDKRPWVSPSVLRELTSNDYVKGIDPVVDFILKEEVVKQ